MRRLMKRVAAAVLMAACLLSLSACSAKQDEAGTAPRIATDGTPVDDMMAEYAKLTAVQSLGVSTDGLIAQKVMSEAQGNAVMAAICEEQINARKELGEVRSIDIEDASVVQMADGTYTVMLPVAFTEGSMQYVMNLNMISQQIVDAEFTELASNEEEGKTIGQLMETATAVSYTHLDVYKRQSILYAPGRGVQGHAGVQGIPGGGGWLMGYGRRNGIAG